VRRVIWHVAEELSQSEPPALNVNASLTMAQQSGLLVP
jgi:hypothetical protein